MDTFSLPPTRYSYKMHTKDDLQQTLPHLYGRSYAAYKDLQKTYDFTTFTLHIDRIQSDPFAAPSHLRVVVPQQVSTMSTTADRWRKYWPVSSGILSKTSFASARLS